MPVYMSLTGARHAKFSSVEVARAAGFDALPFNDFLVFNVAFGKTVPDVSLNAVANLGYAEVRFLKPVFPGDTLRCESTVVGLNENSSGKTGVVYVRSTCLDAADEHVLSWVRWVMVHKRDPQARVGERFIPSFDKAVPADRLRVNDGFGSSVRLQSWFDATGVPRAWDDYAVGERIDHPCGMTMESADHMSATRLYQNNARPHFDEAAMRHSSVGSRLVYGGHVISVCHALAYDGLENVLGVAAINAGVHAAPTVAGDTLYASTRVMEKWDIGGRKDIGALRLRLTGLRNCHPSEFEIVDGVESRRIAGETALERDPAVVLDLDYTVLVPRRPRSHMPRPCAA